MSAWLVNLYIVIIDHEKHIIWIVTRRQNCWKLSCLQPRKTNHGYWRKYIYKRQHASLQWQQHMRVHTLSAYSWKSSSFLRRIGGRIYTLIYFGVKHEMNRIIWRTSRYNEGWFRQTDTPFGHWLCLFIGKRNPWTKIATM